MEDGLDNEPFRGAPLQWKTTALTELKLQDFQRMPPGTLKTALDLPHLAPD